MEKGARVPVPAPPGRTHRGHHHHCCQRPRQEPPHAWKSVAKASSSSPEDPATSRGSWAETGLAHQEHQLRLLPQPLEGFIKARSDVRVKHKPCIFF